MPRVGRSPCERSTCVDDIRLLDWLADAQSALRLAGVDSPELDAQLLAASALGWSRSEVVVRGHQSVSRLPLEALLRRRLEREPLAYIVGHREFFGLDFTVSPAVLIPRPETETLVEAALDWVGREPTRWTRIVDLGTGSGCIAVALASRLSTSVIGVDLSPAALEIAHENARAHEVAIELALADGIAWLESATSTDLVVTNPPYVGVRDALQPEIRDFEPGLALFAGEDGLEFFRRLARIGTRPGILTEIGMGQEDAVSTMFTEAGWRLIESRRDLAGIVRVLGFRP